VSTTFGTLKAEVSEALRDPDLKTFDDAAVGRMVNMGIAEVGRLAPAPFQEDITPVADTVEYILRENEFGGEAVPEIEVARLELWDTTTTPNTRSAVIPPASAGYADDSESGWSNWGGTMYIPSWVFSLVDGAEDDYLYRVWGYSPYVQCTDDDDVVGCSDELKWAIVSYCQVEALQRLLAERDLFAQWQTRAGNTDISPAGIMNALNIARDEWRRKSRAITRLRTNV
jgi:hypothetical protein